MKITYVEASVTESGILSLRGAVNNTSEQMGIVRTIVIMVAAFLSACDGASGPRDAELNKNLFEESCDPEDRIFRLDEVFDDPEWDAICWVREYSSVKEIVLTTKDFPGAVNGDYTYIPKNYYQTDEDNIISLVEFDTRTVQSYIVGPKSKYSVLGGSDFCYEREFAMARCQAPDFRFSETPVKRIRLFDSRKPEPK